MCQQAAAVGLACPVTMSKWLIWDKEIAYIHSQAVTNHIL